LVSKRYLKVLQGVFGGVVCLTVFGSAFAFRDPTEPPAELYEVKKETPAQPRFIVTAIFIAGHKRLAIVNDALVRQGDKIGKKEVKQIDPYSVILSGENGEMTLYLLGSGNSIRK
jgi:hypothetical protein